MPAHVPNDDVQSTGAKPSNPCTLVTGAEAASILGKLSGPPVLAPQGPTCLYRATHLGSLVTLAVDGSLNGAPQHLRHAISVSVGGHHGRCGLDGTPRMLVPLPRGLVLDVGAPCALATPLAKTALAHLGA